MAVQGVLAALALGGAAALAGCASEQHSSQQHTPQAGQAEHAAHAHAHDKTVQADGEPQGDYAMDAIMAAAEPGDFHRKLDPLVGRFKAETKMWTGPDSEPMASSGIMENSWVLGGRFLLSEFEGDDAAMPFAGLGLLGYDNLRRLYTATWADTMGTGLMPIGTGTCSADGKVITLQRDTNDPMTGDSLHVRDVTTILDTDRHTFEMYMSGPDGAEFKTLEITYTRT